MVDDTESAAFPRLPEKCIRFFRGACEIRTQESPFYAKKTGMSLVMRPFGAGKKRNVIAVGQIFVLCAVIVVCEKKIVQPHAFCQPRSLFRRQDTVRSGGMHMGIAFKKPALFFRKFQRIFYGDPFCGHMIGAGDDMPGPFRQFTGKKTGAASQRGQPDVASVGTGGPGHGSIRQHDGQINGTGFAGNAVIPFTADRRRRIAVTDVYPFRIFFHLKGDFDVAAFLGFVQGKGEMLYFIHNVLFSC